MARGPPTASSKDLTIFHSKPIVPMSNIIRISAFREQHEFCLQLSFIFVQIDGGHISHGIHSHRLQSVDTRYKFQPKNIEALFFMHLKSWRFIYDGLHKPFFVIQIQGYYYIHSQDVWLFSFYDFMKQEQGEGQAGV